MIVYIGISFVLTILIVQIIVFIRQYKRSTPTKALIVYGKLDPHDSIPFKIYNSKSVFVWPIIQKFYYLDLSSFSINTEFDSTFMSGEKLQIKIEAQINPDTLELEKLVNHYFKKTKNEIEKDVQRSIELQVQNITSTSTYDADNKRELLNEIAKSVNELIQKKGFIEAEYINVYAS